MKETIQAHDDVSGNVLKQFVMEAIEREGIEIKETFEAALKQSSWRSYPNHNKETKIVIYIPQFTDWSDTQMALLLAYHLGEIQLKRQRDQLEKQGFKASFKAYIQQEKPAYFHHKQAWAWVEHFFEENGFLIKEEDLWPMKDHTMPPSLVSHMIQGMKQIAIHWVLLPLIMAYGFVAAVWLLALNGVFPFGKVNLDGIDGALFGKLFLASYTIIILWKTKTSIHISYQRKAC